MSVDLILIPTELKLLLEFQSIDDPMHVILNDQYGTLADIKNITTNQIQIITKITFPNTLSFQLHNHTNNNFVTLKQLWIGGIELQKNILDQICLFQPTNQNKTTITTNWHNNGIVNIEFFAPDFIQYHLIYNNKINQYLDSVLDT